MVEKRKKIEWLLILQAWTMLWVVIGHSPLRENNAFTTTDMASHTFANVLQTFAYSFHMPLFIMISGYLFYKTRIINQKWTWNKTIKEKLIHLGIPYLFFITLALVIKIFVPGDVDRQVELTPQELVSSYLFPYDGPLREMWFIGVIFIYFCLFPVYKYLLKNKFTTIITLLVAISLFFIKFENLTSFLAFNKAIPNFVFFYVGMLIAHYRLENSVANPVTIGCSAIIAILSFVYPFPFGTKLFGSLLFWGLAIVVEKRITSNVFGSFRNYTYQIFLIGIFVQMLVKIIFNRYYFTNSYPIFYLLCVILGIYIPVLCAKIVEKTNIKFLKRFIGISIK